VLMWPTDSKWDPMIILFIV